MVQYSELQESNREFGKTSRATPFVAVFVGGTSGIGKSTIKALVSTNASLKIYLIGRKSAESRMMPFIEELQTINPNAKVAWLEGEVSLLSETNRVCEIIRSKESHIDLLFLSTGYAPFGPREETAEGLEITQSLRYYTRVLCILQLLPLLREGNGRVVSVLAGGMEWAVTNLDDIDLKKPGSFGVVNAHIQCANMTTATMEKLADDNPAVTFIHSAPGSVDTGNVRRGLASPNSVKAWLIWLFLEPLIRLFSFSSEESAQRHLFQSTSAAFGGRGVRWEGSSGNNSRGNNATGLFLVNEKCDCTMNEKAVSSIRQNAKGKIWDHTLRVLSPYC